MKENVTENSHQVKIESSLSVELTYVHTWLTKIQDPLMFTLDKFAQQIYAAVMVCLDV